MKFLVSSAINAIPETLSNIVEMDNWLSFTNLKKQIED